MDKPKGHKSGKFVAMKEFAAKFRWRVGRLASFLAYQRGE